MHEKGIPLNDVQRMIKDNAAAMLGDQIDASVSRERRERWSRLLDGARAGGEPGTMQVNGHGPSLAGVTG